MTTEPEPQEQSSRGLITALAIFAGVVIVIIYGYLAKPGWVGSSGKQFWDYLDLLIVPAALALGVYWLNRRQTVRDQQAEQAQQERALAVESQRAQDDALQAYLEAMSNLITEHRLRTSQPSNDQDRNAAPEPLTEDEDVTPSSDNDVRAVAQARTLTVLMTLSSGDRDVAIGAGVRKGSVLQFLYDAGLITGHPPPLVVSRADLSNIEMGRFTSHEAARVPPRPHTSGGGLLSPDEATAHLGYIIASGGAKLGNVVLPQVNLKGAYLKAAELQGARLTRAYLSGANLSDAALSRASLWQADLSGADLSRAHLHNADLGSTNLSEANLSEAELYGADLQGAKGWTEEQLLAAYSFEGATMPDGQKLKSDYNPDGPTFEDWLKDKKAREEGG